MTAARSPCRRPTPMTEVAGALFVAENFECFEVGDGSAYADTVWRLTREGVPRLYYRLTPAVYGGLSARLGRVREAAASGRLGADRAAGAVARFALVREWAEGRRLAPGATGELPSPVCSWHEVSGVG